MAIAPPPVYRGRAVVPALFRVRPRQPRGLRLDRAEHPALTVPQHPAARPRPAAVYHPSVAAGQPAAAHHHPAQARAEVEAPLAAAIVHQPAAGRISARPEAAVPVVDRAAPAVRVDRLNLAAAVRQGAARVLPVAVRVVPPRLTVHQPVEDHPSVVDQAVADQAAAPVDQVDRLNLVAAVHQPVLRHLREAAVQPNQPAAPPQNRKKRNQAAWVVSPAV